MQQALEKKDYLFFYRFKELTATSDQYIIDLLVNAAQLQQMSILYNAYDLGLNFRATIDQVEDKRVKALLSRYQFIHPEFSLDSDNLYQEYESSIGELYKRLPLEMWLEILKFVDPTTIRNAMLLCKPIYATLSQNPYLLNTLVHNYHLYAKDADLKNLMTIKEKFNAAKRIKRSLSALPVLSSLQNNICRLIGLGLVLGSAGPLASAVIVLLVAIFSYFTANILCQNISTAEDKKCIIWPYNSYNFDKYTRGHYTARDFAMTGDTMLSMAIGFVALSILMILMGAPSLGLWLLKRYFNINIGNNNPIISHQDILNKARLQPQFLVLYNHLRNLYPHIHLPEIGHSTPFDRVETKIEELKNHIEFKRNELITGRINIQNPGRSNHSLFASPKTPIEVKIDVKIDHTFNAPTDSTASAMAPLLETNDVYMPSASMPSEREEYEPLLKSTFLSYSSNSRA